MIKHDRIFYLACGLSGIGVLLALLGYDLSLLFFVGAYLLRPALREFGMARRFADEREMEIHSRSGNLAFVIVMLAMVGLVFWRLADGRPAGELYMLIGIGLAARALTGLVMAGEYRRAGMVIISAVGVFLSVFIVLDTGFSIGSLVGLIPALLFIGIGQTARKYPKTAAVVFTGLAILFIFVFRLYTFARSTLDLWLLLITPMVTAALCLFMGSGPEEKVVSDRTRTIAFGSLGTGAAIVFVLLLIVGGQEKSTHGHSALLPEGEVKEIQGVSCSQKIEYYDDGSLEFCFLAREDTLSGQPLPAGTGVHFTKDSVFNWCFLPENMDIQGLNARGGGHDFQTRFHPNGQVRTVYLSKDQVIQGVPCARFRFLAAIAGLFQRKGGNTSFYDNGQLAYCELSENTTIQGRSFRRGDAVRFDREGKLKSDQ